MHKDFASQRRAAAGEQVTFTVNNQPYEAVADAPGGVLLDATRLNEGSGTEKVRAVGEFLDAVLLPESRERFESAMHSQDPSWNITLEDAIEVVRWLVSEVYTGRPTTRPSTLPGTRSVGGPSSTTGAPSGA